MPDTLVAERFACATCGDDFPRASALNADGICTWCENRCPVCDEQTVPPDGLNEHGECDSCAVECSECGEALPHGTELDDYSRCDECTITCTECGSCVASTDEYDRGDCCSVVCQGCDSAVESTDRWNHCDSCASYCERCEERICCDECGCDCSEDDDDDEYNGLHAYDWDVPTTPVRVAGERTNWFLGIEIEMENPHASAHDCVVPEYWHKKRDGSLGAGGVEAVSQPYSWEALRALDWSWLSSLRRNGWTSYDTSRCGLHVHVSRKALSACGWYKILTLFENHRSWVFKASRRREGQFEQWCEHADDSTRTRRNKARGTTYGRKYEAVNTSHRHTIEFRLFRGTLDRDAFWRNLCLVTALVGWARQASLADISIDSLHRYLEAGAPRSGLTLEDADYVLRWSRKCNGE